MASPLKTLDFFHNVGRVREIVTTLARHGFGDALQNVGVPEKLLARFVPEEDQHLTLWQRIRRVTEDLGPTFVKFGQVLSTRPDVLPQPLIQELRSLRSQVKPVPFAQIEGVLLHELTAPLEEYFSEFDKEPIAAGSIAQIYKARLQSNGRRVAVKVQRPNIRKSIRADVEILHWLARLAHDNLVELRPYNLPDIIEAAGEGIMQELDFTIEAANVILFNSLNPYPDIFAPHVYDEFNTRRLTVMEWVDGRPPSDRKISPEVGKRLAKSGAKSVLHQIAVAGFFHADPHGGNLMITHDGRGCFIDWGLAGNLTSEMRYFLADLFSAIFDGDPEQVRRVAMIMAVGKHRVDQRALEQEVAFVLRRYQTKESRSLNFGRILIDLLFVFGKNNISLARDYSMLARALMSIEEVGNELDPDFAIFPIAEPFLRRLSFERWNPINLTQRSWWSARSNFARLQELPGEIQRLFRHLEDGEIKINLDLDGVKETVNTIHFGINRLVLAIITGAITLGSAWIVAATVKEEDGFFAFFTRFPVSIGAWSFVLAAMFGVWLMVDIVRHGRYRKK